MDFTYIDTKGVHETFVAMSGGEHVSLGTATCYLYRFDGSEQTLLYTVEVNPNSVGVYVVDIDPIDSVEIGQKLAMELVWPSGQAVWCDGFAVDLSGSYNRGYPRVQTSFV